MTAGPTGDDGRQAPSGQDPDGAAASVDRRPKPQFGELAPPGWTWTPPADPEAVPVPVAAEPTGAEPAQPAVAPVPAAPVGGPPGAGEPPRWDRAVTLSLIIFGIFGLVSTIQVQGSTIQGIAMLHQQEGLPAYTPADSVAAILLWGTIVQVGLWFIAAALSITLVLRKRRAFWVPIAVGVLAGIVMFFVVLLVLLTDAPLLTHFGSTGSLGS